ncbi:MAG: hypothetical protein OEY17_05640 [Nitrosopumilus sp.]|nr:hypothetical protein [Nitrosopumilus sp.]MDH5658805.1 hypothetical protein [Nitrosopumilus sp.]
MNFSKKKKVVMAFTVEKCTKCNAVKKRAFSDGDALFAMSSKCTSCGEITSIEKIFGESLDE